MVRRAETHTSDQYTAGRTVEDGSHAVTEDHRAARSDHDSASRRKPQYSGQDDVVKNAILFGGGFITILVSLYLFASYPDSWLLFLLGILAYGLALMVPTTILNGSTAKHSTGGKEVTLDLPRDSSEMARQPIGAGQRQDNVSL